MAFSPKENRLIELLSESVELLNESTISRIWRHVNDPKTLFAQFSGFRHNYTLEQNVARNKAIASELRKNGWGYFFLIGYWKEKITEGFADLDKWKENRDKKEKYVLSREDSIFVTAPIKQDLHFFKTITGLSHKYEQDAAIVKRVINFNTANKNTETAIVLYDTSTPIPTKIRVFNDFSPGKEAVIYSQLKDRGGNKTYVFESLEESGGLSAKLAYSSGKKSELDERLHYTLSKKDVYYF